MEPSPEELAEIQNIMITEFDKLHKAFRENGFGIVSMTTVEKAATTICQHYATRLAEKDKEIEKLNMHIMSRQSSSDYQYGEDNMQENMMQHIRDFQYPGTGNAFAEAMKAKIDEVKDAAIKILTIESNISSEIIFGMKMGTPYEICMKIIEESVLEEKAKAQLNSETLPEK